MTKKQYYNMLYPKNIFSNNNKHLRYKSSFFIRIEIPFIKERLINKID